MGRVYGTTSAPWFSNGIALTEEALTAVNEFVTPKLKAGLPIPMICNTFRDQVPVSDTTLYSYVENGLLEARNLDLRRKASRPKRVTVNVIMSSSGISFQKTKGKRIIHRKRLET